MSWLTRLAELAAEFGDDVVRQIAKRLPEKATVAEARAAGRAALDRITSARPADVFAARPAAQKPLAARAAPRPKVKALPPPPKPLALPAPGPGLPSFAAKPRGGQWWADSPYLDVNVSPEAAAREGAEALGFKTMRWEPEEPGDLRRYLNPKAVGTSPEQQWLERALAKYYKTEFGAPTDPLRDLAERGLHYDPEMTPEVWQKTVNDYLLEDPLQDIMFPSNPAGGMRGAGDDLRGQVMSTMPWLAKQPVTDNLYGISNGGLDLEHFTDEFYNALNPELSGIPADLAVRPEMLERMSFPQAVERVGRINQWRAKQQAEAMAGSYDNPAVRLFKEYAENNPRGLRWVELRAPEQTQVEPPADWGWQKLENGNYRTPEGGTFWRDPDNMYGFSSDDDYWHHPDSEGGSKNPARMSLQDALKYEGDTMGHCVGGYCDDVLSGRSRIFSLRDAKGEPHVTIETAPIDEHDAFSVAADSDPLLADTWNEYYYGGNPKSGTFSEFLAEDRPDVYDKYKHLIGGQEDIIQIKGKQNRAPNDEYLPFVQDFVKSQQWSNVGDLRNTGLVKLPDGRYITQQQYDDAINSWGLDDLYQSYDFNASGFPRDPSHLGPEDWQRFSQHFEGYAIGGRVEADRCFCHNPLAVPGKKAPNLKVKK